MDAKKWLRQEERLLARSTARQSRGNTGGIKLLPSLIHGNEPSVRCKNVPVIQNGNKIDLDAYEDYE